MLTKQPHGWVRWWKCNWLETQIKRDAKLRVKEQVSSVRIGRHLDMMFVDFMVQEAERQKGIRTVKNTDSFQNTFQRKLWKS